VGNVYANLQSWTNGTTTSTSPNYVQVTDSRGTAAGWSLYAAVSAFTTTGGSSLKGATLNFSNETNGASPSVNPGQTVPGTISVTPGDITSPASYQLISTAAAGTGTGTTVTSFGGPGTADTTGGSSIALNLLNGSVPTAGTYTATMVWDLTAAP
jgi:hypothetical protein